MNNAYSRLAGALAVSILLHAALIAAGMPTAPVRPALQPAQPELKVSLREPLVVPDAAAPAPAFAPLAPQLLLPPHPPLAARRNASAVVAVSASREPVLASASPQPLQGQAARIVAEQLQRDLPYPREAIERGLEGEAMVLLFLDAAGTVIAARLEASSGHGILDDAAVRAARSLRGLPASAPREALLPVRFRLR